MRTKYKLSPDLELNGYSLESDDYLIYSFFKGDFLYAYRHDDPMGRIEEDLYYHFNMLKSGIEFVGVK